MSEIAVEAGGEIANWYNSLEISINDGQNRFKYSDCKRMKTIKQLIGDGLAHSTSYVGYLQG